jgi:cytochrome c peroxidase
VPESVRVRLLVVIGIAGALAVASVTHAAEAPLDWTAAERARIAAHGPWPPSPRPDRSNRVSGQSAAIAFGQRLFFDGRLSAGATVTCAGCHQPGRAWTDGRATAQALAPGVRNTQTLVNLPLQRWFGWGGSSDSLWMASLRAIVDPREMGSSVAPLARRVRQHADLSCAYTQVFERAPPADDDLLAVDIAKALAAFQETLITVRTPFDDFRDALVRGDRAAMTRYPAAAQRGLRLFIGRGNCTLCHGGPNFSHGAFHDTGVPFFTRRGEVDPGRHLGLREVQASALNLLGRFNDDASRDNAIGTRHARLEHRHWGAWRTPSLRNVSATAPYMHDGSVESLRDVLLHYSDLPEERLHADGERILRPLRLSPAEMDDLLAFLQSLDGDAPLPDFNARDPLQARCP